ncbi:hypothetical protein Aasi_0409 [Candidatus Amoebophilus asiaticus 5a2]|uniref:Uncharacterized protein n=1 Tax=Amoebophilus asiaticus (strain 5a2) TaxID=452471 RepID=B3ERH5_AMOA5|nr:ankyrin repeat domain-containing protein [Candidatus Amoebophilus asiaticus]ACE05827.1 hypothetical protein Aasi_0409 [Candidatus Amoebophilus asiaticus 5a2]
MQKKDSNNLARIQKIAQTANESDMDVLLEHCKTAIMKGELFLVAYMVEYKYLPLKQKDLLGNTPLHQAVMKDQPQITDYLARKDSSAILDENDLDETPLSLANDKPEIKRIFESYLK